MTWEIREEGAPKARRLALLLADGTGDFDFVQAVAIQNRLVLEGHVKEYRLKQRAEELAKYVGFAAIENTIRIHPG
jgi:hypothetical protein